MIADEKSIDPSARGSLPRDYESAGENRANPKVIGKTTRSTLRLPRRPPALIVQIRRTARVVASVPPILRLVRNHKVAHYQNLGEHNECIRSSILAVTAAAAGFGAMVVAAQEAGPPTIVATGLEGPRGLKFGPDGDLYVGPYRPHGDRRAAGLFLYRELEPLSHRSAVGTRLDRRPRRSLPERECRAGVRTGLPAASHRRLEGRLHDGRRGGVRARGWIALRPGAFGRHR